MPFGSSSPVAVNGATYIAGFTNGGILVNSAAFAPTFALVSQLAVVSYIRPGTGEIIYARGAGGNGADIATAGPIVNGRDQAAAFANNSLVHIYRITDGVNIANCIASLSPPFAGPPVPAEVTRNMSTILLGPTLPAGYTHWNYAGCVLMNGANLFDGQSDNDYFMFKTPQNILNTAAVGPTNFALPTAAGSNYGIESVRLNMKASLLTNVGGGASSDARITSIVQAATNYTMPIVVSAALTTENDSIQFAANVHSFPAMGNQFAATWINDVNAGNINTRNITVDVAAYRCAFAQKF